MNTLKVGVIGAVGSTAVTLKTLYRHDFEIIGVLGHEPSENIKVSGWFDLRRLSAKLEVPFRSFKKINDSNHLDWMREKNPDVIFAVGFSQMLSSEWLKLPKLGCIGFHPTQLPKGRGRAPLAWLVLEERKGAASFFLMGNGADDGPVFIQEPFKLSQDDDALSTSVLIENAIERALDKWLPELKQGVWKPIPQDESMATWYGKRSPEDGIINWYDSADLIDRLIKATTKPHPGAYTFFKYDKIIILSSEVETRIPIKGVVGRILLKDSDKGFLIQCGNGLIWLKNISMRPDLKLNIGDKLGCNYEIAINEILLELKRINQR